MSNLLKGKLKAEKPSLPAPEFPAKGEQPEPEFPKVHMATGIIKPKIRVELWDCDTDRPKLVASRLVKYGIPYCRIKVGGDKRRYWINYNQLKEGKKSFIYMTNVNNSVASITLQPYEKEKVDPYQAELMLNEGLAETFVRAKTYPMWYILIGLIGTVIGMAILAWLFPAYLNATQQVQYDDGQIVTLQHQITVLKQGQASTPPTGNVVK